MIYDRLGQRIVPGSLMVIIPTGIMCVATNIIPYSYHVEVDNKRVDITNWASIYAPVSIRGITGCCLRTVEVIRNVELF